MKITSGSSIDDPAQQAVHLAHDRDVAAAGLAQAILQDGGTIGVLVDEQNA